jgi:hypothetical protein
MYENVVINVVFVKNLWRFLNICTLAKDGFTYKLLTILPTNSIRLQAYKKNAPRLRGIFCTYVGDF